MNSYRPINHSSNDTFSVNIPIAEEEEKNSSPPSQAKSIQNNRTNVVQHIASFLDLSDYAHLACTSWKMNHLLSENTLLYRRQVFSQHRINRELKNLARIVNNLVPKDLFSRYRNEPEIEMLARLADSFPSFSQSHHEIKYLRRQLQYSGFFSNPQLDQPIGYLWQVNAQIDKLHKYKKQHSALLRQLSAVPTDNQVGKIILFRRSVLSLFVILLTAEIVAVSLDLANKISSTQLLEISACLLSMLFASLLATCRDEQHRTVMWQNPCLGRQGFFNLRANLNQEIKKLEEKSNGIGEVDPALAQRLFVRK